MKKRTTSTSDRRARLAYERKRADAKWSLDVKERAGWRCEKPGCPVAIKGLAAHHVFSRSIKKVRHDLDNGVCLCNGHHMFFAHKYPHMFLDMVIALRGHEWYDRLKEKARRING